MTERVLFTWSGGKDSALALYELQRRNGYDVMALLTTLTEDYDRISMHGVQGILLEQQANSLGLPIEKVYISKNSSNEEYEAKMREILQKHLTAGGLIRSVWGHLFRGFEKTSRGQLSEDRNEGHLPNMENGYY